MAAGKRVSTSPASEELPVMACQPEIRPVDIVESHTNAGISVDEISLLAYRDMLQAMAHPYGILTVKQMKLAKTFARLLGISDARQKLEMRAVYASLESKRQFQMASQEAAAVAAGQPCPFSACSLLSPPPPPPGPLLDTGKVSRHKRKEKKNRTKALLRRVKEAASSPPAASALPQSQEGVQLLNLAGSQVVPPLRRPVPVTPLATTIDRVIEIYRGQVRALWKSQGQRPYGRNAELSA